MAWARLLLGYTGGCTLARGRLEPEGLESELSVSHSSSQGILAVAALAKNRMELQDLEKQLGSSHGFFWGVMMVAFFMGHGAGAM